MQNHVFLINNWWCFFNLINTFEPLLGVLIKVPRAVLKNIY